MEFLLLSLGSFSITDVGPKPGCWTKVDSTMGCRPMFSPVAPLRCLPVFLELSYRATNSLVSMIWYVEASVAGSCRAEAWCSELGFRFLDMIRSVFSLGDSHSKRKNCIINLCSFFS